MPIDKTTQIPKPKDWEELEMLVWDLFRSEWNDPMAVRHGRNGQRQHGVDIYGRSNQDLIGIQVKGKTEGIGGQITEKEMRAEVKKASLFEPPLQRLIFATSAPRDSAVQRVARSLNDENIARGWFAIDALGWDDLQERLTSYPHLLKMYFPQIYGGRELGLLVPRQPDIVVETHQTKTMIALKVHNKGEAANFKATAKFNGPKASEGPIPLIWGLESREGNKRLMKGDDSYLLIGSCEFLPDYNAYRIDIWKHTGERKPMRFHPAFWRIGSRPDDQVSVDIHILSEPALVTPFEQSYVIRFDQVDNGATLEQG